MLKNKKLEREREMKCENCGNMQVMTETMEDGESQPLMDESKIKSARGLTFHP